MRAENYLFIRGTRTIILAHLSFLFYGQPICYCHVQFQSTHLDVEIQKAGLQACEFPDDVLICRR